MNSKPNPVEFTVGICATGDPNGVLRLAKSILAEGETKPNLLQSLIVVASSCPNSIISGLRELQRRDDRLDLVVENERRGKSEAINEIFARTRTPLVMMVNSDSTPEEGAMGELLASAIEDKSTGAVSALPVPETGRGLVSLLTDFMWSTHNRCSVALNHMNISNHSSDELVLYRTEAIGRLPEGLVNDGAFLAGVARRKGFAVKVCQRARVHVRTPGRISEVVLQRRRILFGHEQVWRKMGTPPKTVESLLFLSPAEGVRLLVGALSGRPEFLWILPIALVSELSALLLSIRDTMTSSTGHAVWRRFA